MPTLEMDIELDRVSVPLGPLLVFLYRLMSLSVQCCIYVWLIVLCVLVWTYGTKVEKFLEGVRVTQVEVKTAGGSGPASAGTGPDAGGT